jgi:hypothetical protein
MLLLSVSISLLRGLEIENCGCFGVFWPRRLGIQTFVEDSVMLGLSMLVLRQSCCTPGRQEVSSITRKRVQDGQDIDL